MNSTELEKAEAVYEATKAAANAAAANGVVWTPAMVQTLSIALLVFTFLVLMMASFLLYKKDQWGLQTLRVFGIILIISLASMLLVVGYSNEQLTPIVGLFGAIAGYLLGRTNQPPAAAAGAGAASSGAAGAQGGSAGGGAGKPRSGPRLPLNPEQ